VVLATRTVTLAAGQTRTIQVKLRVRGHTALARFKRVPAELTISLTIAGQRSTVATLRLIVKPRTKPARRRR
jgi:hypothetical protein